MGSAGIRRSHERSIFGLAALLNVSPFSRLADLIVRDCSEKGVMACESR